MSYKHIISQYRQTLWVILFFIIPSTAFSQDSLRLVNFYHSTNGQNWINKENWLSEHPIDEWYGITVKDSNLTVIELVRNNLSGYLPPDFGGMTNMEILNLSDNSITGELPKSIERLNKLTDLNLSHNRFSRNINSNIKMPNNLINMDLSNNLFTGSIPKSIAKLTKLEILNLSNNNFQNTIPLELFRLQQLTELNLQNNDLTGAIPRQIGNCTNLQILDLSRNNFTNSIPKEIGKLTNLTERLALDHNNLDGMIPKEICLLTNLKHLWLNNNKLSGILPFEFGDMKSIQSLFIYQNNLVGPLPLTLGYLRDLELLYAQNNSFSGKVPNELWFLPKLKMLKLANNKLSGKIPGNLNILSSIQTIDISNNHFNEISDLLSLPSSMLFLNVSNNDLFCTNTDEIDSSVINKYSNFQDRLIGIEVQNCIEKDINSYSISTNNIDFENVDTDSTSEFKFMIVNNDSVQSNISLEHFDQNNFYLSNTQITLLANDTVDVSLYYFPTSNEIHYDVIIIGNEMNISNDFISIIGRGVDSSLPERDISIPWKFALHLPVFSEEDKTINLAYDIPEQRNINIAIYNLGGRPVKTIADGNTEAGYYNYTWDLLDDQGNEVKGGEYLCVMQSGMFIQIQPILLFL